MQLQKEVASLKATLSPSPTPTANPSTSAPKDWKTYTNEKFGFSINYPLDAKTTTRNPDPFPVAVQIDNLMPCTGKTCGGWLIIVSETQPNTANTPLRQWAIEKHLTSDLLLKQGNQTPINDTTIGGQPTIRWNTTGGDASLTYYLIKRDTGMTLIVVNDVTSENTKIIDQILSTFKFTGQDETAGWIDTTTNTAFVSGIPYSFKYPPTATIGGAGDFTTITVNGSEIRFGYYGKQGDVNTLMNNYQPFAAPGPSQFINKESISINGLTGYKATATNSTATYYILASQTKPTSVVLFTFTTGNTAAENLLLQIIGTIKTN